MADRKAELERKKQRLQQMRDEKERRRKERERLDAETAAATLIGNRAASESPSRVQGGSADRLGLPRDEARASIDRVLADVGIAPVDLVLKSVGVGGSSLTPSQSSSLLDGLANSIERASTGDSYSLQHQGQHQQPSSLRTLSIAAVQSTNIPPKEVVHYAKQTQTIESGPMAAVDSMIASRRSGAGLDFYTLAFDDADELYEEDSLPGMGSGGSGSPSAMAYLSQKLPPGFLPHGMPEVKDVKPAVTKEEESEDIAERKRKEEEEKKKQDLSEEEKQVIMISDDFLKFFDRSSRLVERALCEIADNNLFVDYTGRFGDDEQENLDGEKGGSGMKLSLNRCFSEERWTKNRVITSMDWSTVFPELLLTSYDKNVDSVHDPDGICLVWNTRFKKTTPEHIFHCQSQVMSATFARFHPNLVLGGTYSGQIVLWDNRVGQKRTPVQRSPLSALAHTHPVYCMKVVGSQNAHNLISISTDGRLCSWSLDMLSQPQETLELQHKQGKPVAVTSLAFPAGDVNNFIVGSEEGHVYTACRHGSKVGIMDVFEGHVGAPVTGLSSHNGQGSIDFSHLFLTSSIDWTVKLWSLKDNRPLYSFEDNGDYVFDVAWSPVHPALFAAVDGNGRLDLWNLNNDTEVSTASVVVGAQTGGEVTGCPVALNRVSWTQSGLHVTVGDDMGKLWVYDVGESLAIPSNDEWSKFAHTLGDIKQNKTDQEEYDRSLNSTPGGGNSYSMSVAPLGVVPGGSGPNSLSSLTSMSSSPMR